MNLRDVTNRIIQNLWNNSLDKEFSRHSELDRKMRPRNLYEFLERLGIYPDEINFYPGTKSIGCRETAVFMCLTKAPSGAKWMKKSDMLSLDKMLPIIIQHMQGKCMDTTMKMSVITDDISMAEINKWRNNLKNIQLSDQKEVLITYVDPVGNSHEINLLCGLLIP